MVNPLTGAPTVASLAMCRPLESLFGNADSDLRDWDPGYLAVKENGCSCIFAAGMTDVHTD